jgi:hypothetical protein
MMDLRRDGAGDERVEADLERIPIAPPVLLRQFMERPPDEDELALLRVLELLTRPMPRASDGPDEEQRTP